MDPASSTFVALALREAAAPAVFPPRVASRSVEFAAPEDQAPTVLLPAAEVATAVERRRREFAAGRLCARAALAKLAPELAGAPLPIGPRRAPRWPEGYVGSISHGGGFAWAVAARRAEARGLGVDVEPVIADAVADEIEDQIVAPDELRALDLPHRWALTVAYSLKEALFKCLHADVGRYFGFRDVAVERDAAGTIACRLLVDLAPAWRSGRRIPGRVVLGQARVFTGVLVR